MERNYQPSFEGKHHRIEGVEKTSDGKFIEYSFAIGNRKVMIARLIGEGGIEKIADICAEMDTPEIREKLKKRLGLEI